MDFPPPGCSAFDYTLRDANIKGYFAGLGFFGRAWRQGGRQKIQT
jgi:hypothetical protein